MTVPPNKPFPKRPRRACPGEGLGLAELTSGVPRLGNDEAKRDQMLDCLPEEAVRIPEEALPCDGGTDVIQV